MEDPVVVIGGDAAGMSAAAKYKREKPEAHVLVFEQGEDISYSACGMPYWIAGIVDSERDLVMLTPEIARRRRGIDVQIGHRVVQIDPAAKTVSVKAMPDGKIFLQPYEKLVIATGARAARPPIPGVDLAGTFTLRSLHDGRQIWHYLDDQQPRRALIIGGGYIGIEMAEALCHRGLSVTVVEMLPNILPNFDHDMVGDVAQHVEEMGVTLLTGRQVTQITRKGTALSVALSGVPEPLLTDLVLVSTGVRPNAELAASSGLRIGSSGAIWVDKHMRTSDPHIFAAGDCAEHHHLVLGENAWIPLATSANKGGRVVGENLAGAHTEFPGILGTAVVKAFDYTLSTTGLTETHARATGQFGSQGTYVGSAQITSHDKAGFWPGAEQIAVKLVFDKRGGRILGGQLVGKAGVNKRIDIVATAITAEMTVFDVALLDLSYSPPYSPTYDPIQICANVAQRDII